MTAEEVTNQILMVGKDRKAIEAILTQHTNQQSARIRELEGVAESVLFEVSRTISPELRERIEQILNKTEKETE